jgi:hypothetical protein
MPIKEFLVITNVALTAIFAAHPFDFSDAFRKVELSILKEASRTDDWGDPSFSGAKKYILNHPIIYSNRAQKKAHSIQRLRLSGLCKKS